MRVSEHWSTCDVYIYVDGSHRSEERAHRAWGLIVARWPDARVASIFKVICTDDPHIILEVQGVKPGEIATLLEASHD